MIKYYSIARVQRTGVVKIHGTGKLTAFEKKLLDAAIPELQANIKKGVEFAKSH